ncbi:glycosyltransferase family 69 protein [Heterobasidion irregulare TC 32-1]|uniref:Glycosyltransferase family 69 protein n=1 Tax=Heterobasidion irregulare (strain TC 32-1) TaxID=747525 RepID=W4JSK2_HETIT|nr:glycosyltransferase family 69 protein [Heterobasidion irregulare TC 32-1]ETW76434.1 glycosyltransferase family 69 protein [Heterobasidion irregulare TC 32-1]
MAFNIRRRNLTRVVLALGFALVVRFFVVSSTPSYSPNDHEIQGSNMLDLVSRPDNVLDVRRYKFLQSRVGRDEKPDLLGDIVTNGVKDFWERFQKPYIVGKDTAHMDAQNVVTSIEQLFSLNGWVAALCPTLTRPFGQNKHEHAYDDIISKNHLYYIGIVIHSADHFLVDQLAVIVQLAKRLGPSNLFVSMLDYDSTDSTATLTDLSEAVLTLLGVPFRIRKVPGMTEDPNTAYYPLEEAHMRNLALEPLKELYQKRNIKFHRVIWLKGFTCPNDIFETLKISEANEAAMVCGMDWAEHNGFFIFSDRWRTRDINGDQFRQSKSSSKPDAVPPRDAVGSQRYSQHLPFQVFCCESGTHVVDPAQSYYEGIFYRSGTDFHNVSGVSPLNDRAPDAPCLDSSQAWFCRDLWTHKANEGMKEVDAGSEAIRRKKRAVHLDVQEDRRRAVEDEVKEGPAHRQPAEADPDANAGSDYDAMPDSDVPLEAAPAKFSIPNSVFRPARILVNPRCVTTYAGVSHTQLALDLFGPERDSTGPEGVGKYVLDDWEGAPESFVCQEQRQTGGRKATKTQRRLGFSIHEELERAP